MRLQAPCKDCEGRHVGCHSECRLYIDFNNKCQKDRDKRAERSEERYRMIKQIAESKKRMERGKR